MEQGQGINEMEFIMTLQQDETGGAILKKGRLAFGRLLARSCTYGNNENGVRL